MATPPYATLRDLSYGSWEFDVVAVLGHVLEELKPAALDLTFGVMTCGATPKRYVLDTKRGMVREISDKTRRRRAHPPANWLVVSDGDALEALLRGRVSPVTLIQHGDLRYIGSQSGFMSMWSMLAASSAGVARPCDER
jgi:hypothetical protein